MTKSGQEIASYYWISGITPTKNSLEECSLKIISIHCENGHIVESYEIIATVTPSAEWYCNCPKWHGYVIFPFYVYYLSVLVVVKTKLIYG